MARLDKERQAQLEPDRMAYAKKKITDAGFAIEYETETELGFRVHGDIVKFFPYSGWHTGKPIKDGRGLENLMKQIRNKNTY